MASTAGWVAIGPGEPATLHGILDRATEALALAREEGTGSTRTTRARSS